MHSVTGTVTGDGGAPVANVHVRLANPMDKQPGYECFGCYSDYEGVTDSSGNYSIDDVSDGFFLVLFLGESQGYLDGYYNTTGHFTTTLADAQSVDVSGSDLTGISVQLGKQFYIQGRLTAPGGSTGAAGVSVIAWTGDMGEYNAVAITQSTGDYSVPVIDGTYYLLFMDLNGVYLNGVYDTTSPHNFSLDTTAGVPVDATSGTVTGKDAQLATGLYVSGKVFDTAGQPLPGVEVVAFEDYDNYRGETTTKSDGSYSLDLPANLGYILEFAQQHQVPWDYGCYKQGAAGNFADMCGTATDFTLSASRTGVNVTMETGYYISGTISQQGAGAVKDESVYIYLNGDTPSFDEITTAADGSYEFAVWNPESFTLYAFDWHGKHLNGFYDSTGTGNFSTHYTDATLFPVFNDVSVSMTLGVGDLISGTVTGSSTPLPGTYVEADSAADFGHSYSGAAYTGDTGDYSIVVPDGTYRVFFEDPSGAYVPCWYVPSSFTFDFNTASDVTVPPNATGIDVDLPIGHTISGTVTSPDAGHLGLDGITVVADSAGYENGTSTDSDGNYVITVPAGTYTISLADPSGEFLSGYYDETGTNGFAYFVKDATPVTVGPNATGIDVQLVRGNQIHGRATNLDGTPIENLEVDVTFPTYSGSGVTDVNGNYSVAVLSGPGMAYTISTYSFDGSHVHGFYCSTCVNHFTTDQPSATPVTVNGSDVLGINFAVPGDPGAPRNVTAIAGDGQALVSWTAPATDGGFAITDYTVVDQVNYNTCDAGATLSCNFTGLDNQTSYTFIVYATSSFGQGADSDLSDPVTTHSIGTFHPVTPIRLVDSRIGVGLTKLSAAVPQSFDVIDTMGLPHLITAVTANVTIVSPSAASSVYLGPDALVHPKTATISFNKFDVTAYGSTIAVGEDGTISATYMAASGTTNLVVDVTGYFTPDATGDTYHPLTPARILDTRSKNGLSGKFVALKPRTFTVRGRGGVPAGAVAVTGNLTVTNASAAWAVYLGPIAYVKPATSTINFSKGQTRANSLTVILSPTGTLSATFLSSGKATIDMVFDVTGYYTADGTGQSYIPITPNSLLDTRTGNGLSGKFSAGVPRTFGVWNRGDVPASAKGVTGIVSVVNQTGAWAIFIGPIPTAKPSTSALNFLKGDNCSNGFTVPLSATGTLSPTFLGSKGTTTNVVVIVTGYFEVAP